MSPPPSRTAPVLPPAPPRPPAGSPAPPAIRVDPSHHCPRCHTLLTDPHGIGLCPRCGFCRSLEVDGAAALAAAGRPRRVGGWHDLPQALRAAPAAFVAVAVAFAAVVPLALVADRHFPPGSRARALWSAGHLACGVLLLSAGQAWAVAILKQLKERVGWGDMLSPLQLWGLAARRLPETAWPVGLGGSGALAVLSAVVWVGGLSYWLRLDPGPDGDGPSARAARLRGDGREAEVARVARVLGLRQARDEEPPGRAPESPVESSVEAVPVRAARPAAGEATRPASAPAADSRPVEKCVIVGIVPASAGQAPGLVLATLREGKLSFAGVVRGGVSQRPELLDRLSKLGRSRPLIDGLKLDAVWVRPEVFCEVHQSGVDADGQFVDPKLKGLIED